MDNSTPMKPNAFMRLISQAGNLMPIALIAFVLAALYGIFALGVVFKLGIPYSAFVAVGSVALVLGHAGSIQNSTANVQRLLHGLGLLVWIVLILFFVVLYFGVASVGVTAETPEADISAKLAGSFLSSELLDTGRTAYSYAVAVGLVTALTATVVSYAMAHPLADKLHTTLGASFAPMAINIVTGLIVVTSALHLLNYGMEFAGVGMFEAIAACVVAELTFVAAEQSCLKEMKAREKDEVFDKFDLGAWALLAVLSMTYMVLVNKVYGVMAETAALYPDDHVAGLAAAQAATSTGLLAFARGLYPISAPVFGGALIALKIITTLVSVNGHRKEAGLDDQAAPGWSVRNPRQRLAKDTPPVGALKSGRKRSETGTEYDATAEFEVPADETSADDDREALQQKGPDMSDLRRRARTAANRTCAECGTGFNSERADAKYCSDACRKKSSRRRANEASAS